jgi:HK97 family phage prohead protease
MPQNVVIVRHRAAYAAALKVEPSRPDEFALVRRWTASVEVEMAKKMKDVKDEAGNVTDYRGITLKGYLSTFESTTPADRQGDYVERGAFEQTLARFMENPVLLKDHRNSTDSLAGHFTKIEENRKGLYVEAVLSDAPDNLSLRFKVAEGSLKALSMGGKFHYKEDGRGIFRVDLWEGSIVPIPANPDARFTVRCLDDRDRRYVKSAGQWRSYYDFLESEVANGMTK